MSCPVESFWDVKGMCPAETTMVRPGLPSKSVSVATYAWGGLLLGVVLLWRYANRAARAPLVRPSRGLNEEDERKRLEWVANAQARLNKQSRSKTQHLVNNIGGVSRNSDLVGGAEELSCSSSSSHNVNVALNDHMSRRDASVEKEREVIGRESKSRESDHKAIPLSTHLQNASALLSRPKWSLSPHSNVFIPFSTTTTASSSSASAPSAPSAALSSSAPSKDVGIPSLGELLTDLGFFHGPDSYLQAATEALAVNKMMFVVIYSATEPASANLVRVTLAESVVYDFLQQNYVLWAGRIGDRNARSLGRFLNVFEYPFVACVTVNTHWPNSDVHHPSSRAIVRSAQGEISSDLLLGVLAEAVQFWDQGRYMGENEIEEQDREYREALEVDIKQQRSEKQAQDAEDVQEDVIESAFSPSSSLLPALPPLPVEPPASQGTCFLTRTTYMCTINVCIRLLGGQTLKRRFLASDTIGDLLFFGRHASQSQSSSLSESDDWILVTNFPRRIYSDFSQRLDQLDLGNQLLFHIDRFSRD